MSLRLARIPFRDYAQTVLPLTHSLWGGGRSLDAYIERTRAFAESAYGRKHYSLMALVDGASGPLASFKRYEREARVGKERLRAIGIGAVFTPEPLRGCGHATAMLAIALDEARAAGCDFAFLYSDIHPQFYRELGFLEMPSRSISVRADSLPAQRIRVERIGDKDWSSVRECFAAMEASRSFAFVRSALFWSAVRFRVGDGDNYCVRDGAHVAAYVLGRREPTHDAYIADEFAFRDDAAKAIVAPLLRSAAGDLRRVTGWLPPLPARRLLPRGSVRPRSRGVLMLAPLTDGGKRFADAAVERSSGDPVWIADHV